MFAFSGAAGAAVTTPLVSTAASASGTALHVTFNETPVLSGSYSLSLADGSTTGTFSSTAGTLSAAVNGTSIDFTLHGATSLSLGSLLEILGSTGVSDATGNPWNLVASGQVDKSYVLSQGDQVVVNYNEPVTVAANYSLTLKEGSGSATVDQGNSNVSGQGTSTITYNVTGSPSGSVAADGPTVSNFTGVSAAAVQVGDTLKATFATPVTAPGPGYSLTLSDSVGDAGTFTTPTNLSAPIVSPDTPAVGQTTVTYMVTGAATSPTGAQLFAQSLHATASTGLVGAPASFPLTISAGPQPPAPAVVAGPVPAPVTVIINPSTTCSNIGVTRVFGGTNCDIGFANAGPTTPDVFDVIPLPTTDLPGPPNDNAPEVITNCAAGSKDVVYDVNTGAELGANLCGNNPNEGAIGNTFGPTLDYISTPNLASFEQVGVVETITGSTYVSATAVPPQLSAVTVNNDKATFTYYGNVVCQDNSNNGHFTSSQFTYITPYTDLVKADRVFANNIACGGGGNSLTVTFPGTIPVSSGVRFKFEGYGAGSFIVGAPGSVFANEREASESAYAGPGAMITAFTPSSTTMATSSGGTVNVAFATTSASTCSISAVSLPAGAAALSLPSVASCNGSGTIGVPANTNSNANAIYTVTLTADIPGTPAANAEITITVPAAPPPAPIVITPTPPMPIVPPPLGGEKAHIAAPYTRLVLEQISSKHHTAKFVFKATGASTGFRCALVRLPTRKGAKQPSPKYAVCGSLKTFKHLKAGRYVLYVRAIGPGGVRSPIIFRFSIK